ncbi:MAG: hypothetical protein HOC77_13690 [Chloroflexi bacterium]|nr:hypothetical protein [Chloroflexota bacterium]MBT4073829.1 hypothetical protein [Chloroflexota bacterium]MBT4516128.1 hypothetical protein [Chloroflexota bacterium]MBT5320002.1 hypothetical protein [Chloroflexota bacterium]MBT6682259.1 hypothetical protein [Chloroflexota bacterium]
MFEKSDLDALFGDLEGSHGSSEDYDRLLKETHLAVALSDAQRPLDDQFDSVVVALVEKHKPAD